jgi:hypothetical protein
MTVPPASRSLATALSRARSLAACSARAPTTPVTLAHKPLHLESRFANHDPRPAGATLKVSGFTPERCPASPRNAVRLPIGTCVRLRRNPHFMVEYLADRDIPRTLNAPQRARHFFGRLYRHPAAVAKRRS